MDSADESRNCNNINSNVRRKESALVYINACFEPTEESPTTETGNEDDLRLNDQRLYTHRSNELPLISSQDISGHVTIQEGGKKVKWNRKSICNGEALSSQTGNPRRLSADALHKSQSCNPTYLAMDVRLLPDISSPYDMNDFKRSTISIGATDQLSKNVKQPRN